MRAGPCWRRPRLYLGRALPGPEGGGRGTASPAHTRPPRSYPDGRGSRSPAHRPAPASPNVRPKPLLCEQPPSGKSRRGAPGHGLQVPERAGDWSWPPALVGRFLWPATPHSPGADGATASLVSPPGARLSDAQCSHLPSCRCESCCRHRLMRSDATRGRRAPSLLGETSSDLLSHLAAGGRLDPHVSSPGISSVTPRTC